MTLYDRLAPPERALVRRLWALAEAPEPEAERWERLWAAMTPAEAATPLARWLRRAGSLSWPEHVSGFLSAVFGIRNRPWFAEEYPPAYQAAYQAEREQVAARLAKED
jgi:hypothetical protein